MRRTLGQSLPGRCSVPIPIELRGAEWLCPTGCGIRAESCTRCKTCGCHKPQVDDSGVFYDPDRTVMLPIWVGADEVGRGGGKKC